jgi:alkylresorcinol/alkylpyrone synthase
MRDTITPVADARPPGEREKAAPVALAGLGLGLAPHVLEQRAVKGLAARRFARHADFARLARSFDTAGVARRRSVVPLDWFEADRGWQERTAAYLDGATALFEKAARRALADAGLAASAVDTVVTVSSTGIATPTLEARAFARLGFRRDVRRVPVFGLGCAGGVTGLATAARLARARPGDRVLMVAVETCTLGFRGGSARKADIVASILFGDGAAAACLTTEPDAAPAAWLGEGVERLWPDTLGIMGWEVDGEGLGVVFDRSIPEFVRAELAGALDEAAGALLDGARPARVVLHPGGAKVVEAAEAALALAPGTLDHERAVLAEHGNMSAPTVLFVLRRVLADPPAGPMLASALGPGFTASTLAVTAGG